jgi:hypothetical protein
MRDHYQEAYWQAREALYRRDKKVGKPVYRQDGLRYCPVDGSALTDRDVLKEAWGVDLADEILREWAESSSLNCPDCDRLWWEYLRVAKDYLQILRLQQIQVNVEESVALANVAKSRHNARQSLRTHVAMHGAEPVLTKMR